MLVVILTNQEFNILKKQMKNIILCSFLFISILSYSQDLNQGNVKNKEYYSDIKFEYINGKIIIPVKINNITYRFLLDTGAPNCISKKLNESINSEILKKIDVKDANNRKTVMNIVKIPDLEIGNIIFENSVALSSDEEKNLVFDCFKIDGLIGSNLLRNSIIQIDIKNKILRITNDKEKLIFKKKNSTKISLIGTQSSPYIWLTLKEKNSAKEQVLLDTGMNGFYDIANRNYNLLKKENIIKINSVGIGSKDIGLFGNADINEQLRLIIPEIIISNSKFVNITTITTNDKNSRIGIDLFEYGIGTIDFIDKKFYYDEYKEELIDLKENLLGFSATIIENKLSIGIVWNENLKDKIFIGDEIIEVNGENLENYQICDLVTKKSIFKNIEIKEIVVKTKSGELKKVNL